MKYLKYFPKNSEGLYIIYDRYSFDNFFRLILKNGLNHEDSLSFVLYNCSLSALVFQERIYNKYYLRFSAKDALSSGLASRKSRLIFDVLYNTHL